MKKIKDSIVNPMKTIAVNSREWFDYVTELNECAYGDDMIRKIIEAAAKLAKETDQTYVIEQILGKSEKHYVLVSSSIVGIDSTTYNTEKDAQTSMKEAWERLNEDSGEDGQTWCNLEQGSACAYSEEYGFLYWEIVEV